MRFRAADLRPDTGQVSRQTRRRPEQTRTRIKDAHWYQSKVVTSLWLPFTSFSGRKKKPDFITISGNVGAQAMNYMVSGIHVWITHKAPDLHGPQVPLGHCLLIDYW